MFFITGITGNTGAAAAEALLDQGHGVRALVRDPAKAAHWAKRGVELVQGDITDVAVLSRALTGVSGAYLMVPPDAKSPDPVGWYVKVATAMKAAVQSAGLARFVFLSSEGAHLAEGTGPIAGVHKAEQILAGAAATVTFLRPSFFQENWRDVFGLAEAQGIMPAMMADLDSARSMIATRDIGRMAATLLLEDHPPGIVELASATSYSARDAARAMETALGKPVMPVQPPREQWQGILTGAGLSPAFATLIGEMYDGINTGHVRFAGQGERRTGPTTLNETVKSWATAA